MNSPIGDVVKEQYDNTLKGAASNLWHRMTASGFAKGALLTAVLVMGSVALLTGWLGTFSALSINGATISTFGQGITAGIAAAGTFLVNGLGLATLAIGGLIGMAAEAHRTRGEMTPEMAEEQAKQFEIRRQLELAQEIKRTYGTAPIEIVVPPASRRLELARELKRTYGNQTQLMPATVPTDGFMAREMQRRTQAQNSGSHYGIA